MRPADGHVADLKVVHGSMLHLVRPVEHPASQLSALADREAVLVRRRDEGAEQRMRLQRLGLELGMELAAQEEGVVGDLDDLDVGPSGVVPVMRNPPRGQQFFVFAIELVTMAMPFADLGLPVRLP